MDKNNEQGPSRGGENREQYHPYARPTTRGYNRERSPGLYFQPSRAISSFRQAVTLLFREIFLYLEMTISKLDFHDGSATKHSMHRGVPSTITSADYYASHGNQPDDNNFGRATDDEPEGPISLCTRDLDIQTSRISAADLQAATTSASFGAMGNFRQQSGSASIYTSGAPLGMSSKGDQERAANRYCMDPNRAHRFVPSTITSADLQGASTSNQNTINRQQAHRSDTSTISAADLREASTSHSMAEMDRHRAHRSGTSTISAKDLAEASTSHSMAEMDRHRAHRSGTSTISAEDLREASTSHFMAEMDLHRAHRSRTSPISAVDLREVSTSHSMAEMDRHRAHSSRTSPISAVDLREASTSHSSAEMVNIPQTPATSQIATGAPLGLDDKQAMGFLNMLIRLTEEHGGVTHEIKETFKSFLSASLRGKEGMELRHALKQLKFYFKQCQTRMTTDYEVEGLEIDSLANVNTIINLSSATTSPCSTPTNSTANTPGVMLTAQGDYAVPAVEESNVNIKDNKSPSPEPVIRAPEMDRTWVLTASEWPSEASKSIDESQASQKPKAFVFTRFNREAVESLFVTNPQPMEQPTPPVMPHCLEDQMHLPEMQMHYQRQMNASALQPHMFMPPREQPRMQPHRQDQQFPIQPQHPFQVPMWQQHPGPMPTMWQQHTGHRPRLWQQYLGHTPWIRQQHPGHRRFYGNTGELYQTGIHSGYPNMMAKTTLNNQQNFYNTGADYNEEEGEFETEEEEEEHYTEYKYDPHHHMPDPGYYGQGPGPDAGAGTGAG